jgi:predicted phosphodiesterase
MKIAIVSDIHLGDEQCALVDKKSCKLTDHYNKFRDSVGDGNDFLVLTGDILDFSVSLYQDTYKCARTFFKKVLEDGLTKQFIYLPGNHDTNVWHTVEHETNIINRMGPDQQVRRFRHSVPAILDDRQQDDWDKFLLYGVNPKSKGAGAKYGGLYLDQIVDGESVFNIAHPNLYLISNEGKGTLITHGHYFQQYWTMASWLALAVARDNLSIGALDVNELVGINFPLVQLACTGVGQSGPLSPVINQVQKDVKTGELKLVTKYLSKLKRVIDDYWDFERFDNELSFLNIKEKLSDKLLDFIEDYVIKKLELKVINDDVDCTLSGLPEPEAMVFGHTHIPRPWEDYPKPSTLPLEMTGGRIIQLMNCGGWLKDERGDLRGANVFKYETGTLRFETIAVI